MQRIWSGSGGLPRRHCGVAWLPPAGRDFPKEVAGVVIEVETLSRAQQEEPSYLKETFD